MLKEISISVPKRPRQSEMSTYSISGHGIAPVGINIQLIKELRNDRFELRNKIAGLVVVDPDKEKASIVSGATPNHPSPPRATIMARKSTRGDLQMQLRRTKIIHPVQLFQNTYRLEPYKSFDSWCVLDIIKDTFKHNLKRFTYEPRAAAIMAKGLSEEIKFRVKLENYDRCRIVCLVTITQRLHQNFQEVCRTLLDGERDNYVNYAYEGNRTIYAVGTVFGIYYE